MHLISSVSLLTELQEKFCSPLSISQNAVLIKASDCLDEC